VVADAGPLHVVPELDEIQSSPGVELVVAATRMVPVEFDATAPSPAVRRLVIAQVWPALVEVQTPSSRLPGGITRVVAAVR
jgi:hypothetical protein